jgi:hypothetical protein
MHRATPLSSSFRAFVAGGARSVVTSINDMTQMQEMGGRFMAGEMRKALEAPQNYGFTSVVHKAEEFAGKIMGSAETFMQFMGGNRSFPVAQNMDDRRHRLTNLKDGDTAMFRGRGDMQQFHMTQDGGFWSGPRDKTLRMQLVDKDSSSNSTVKSDGSQGQRGQQAVYQDGQKSYRFVDVTKDAARMSGDAVHLMLQDGQKYVEVNNSKNVKLGGQGSLAQVITKKGPSKNVFARYA